MANVMDQIVALFDGRGTGSYFGEPVSVLEHGLQAAHFAREDGCADAVVLAALLHDVGHLLEDVPEDVNDWHHDARHEAVGARWLAKHFGPEVTDPVRLHVPAKRYLCATHASYAATLSPASVLTLALQGGPMSAAEVADFEREPYFKDAVAVRHCDDRGKLRGLPVDALESYRPMIEALVRRG
jgi:phosphonate degradation associated HDIG domain protein